MSTRRISGFAVRKLRLSEMTIEDRNHFLSEAKIYLKQKFKMNTDYGIIMKLLTGKFFVQQSRKTYRLIPVSEMYKLNDEKLIEESRINIFDEEIYNHYNKGECND